MLSSIPNISFTRTLYQATRSSPLSRSLRTSSALMSSFHHEPGPIEASIHEKVRSLRSTHHI
ncbi:BZ3500_MvSof-1268-A1-R1_Chr4-2g06892 [Microbotryum saponariae]|uniref:BZ3500_MvSof-1268-A1-R1_Chr4-2g06892 protein n=1 Tax=Microbotryum saponariae TaxID=289078 RepID=A0A2X0NLM6_9BASI|nr:BZ3500_MvSof-1268-A1-R1_Chr4-2g06892 [Microbotryum saponariae]SDA06557.1 BZ3501_MvSof-1269-A2-R1_Chr4-2g06603 [Microbotryum saponariae]